MGFHENAVFPGRISERSAAGPGYKTAFVELPNGHSHRTATREQPIHRFDVSSGINSWADLMDVRKFYNARRGGAFGFRMQDWFDYTTALDGRSAPTNVDQTLGTGDGTTTTFQLIKGYTDSGETLSRVIEKPVAGSAVVALDAVDQSSGWALDATTGIITFSTAPALGEVVTAGCQFHVPVHFGEDVDEWLGLTAVAFQSGELPPIELVEDPGQVAAPEQTDFGGAAYEALTGNKSLTLADANFQNLDPNGADRDVILPNVNKLPGGFPFWTLRHAGGANTLTVKDALGTTIVVLSTGDLRMIANVVTSSGRVWYAVA